ncbi:MAG: OsmC family protein [Halopseudomonas sp.]
MSNSVGNKLLESGKPLFFKVGNNAQVGEMAPAPRLGEDLRTAVRSLTVFQKEALVTSAKSGVTWRLASDEGAYLDGTDYAPAPLCFLTVGMVAAYMNEILALAKLRGIGIDHLRLIQDNYYSMKGSMGRGTMVASAYDVDLEVQIEADADRETLLRLVMEATAASPLNGLMRGNHESLFTLSHNGKELQPAKALPIGEPAEKDPGVQMDRSEPDLGDWSELCVKGGLTPEHKHSVSGANSSLTDQQDRLLHLRGICTLRPDGIKEIVQHLYNPHGSVFTLLSEEAPASGGQGRAPDAASYISAGIGFCFMTQFGRYAKMKRKDLTDYRILQDSHFSLGGASGGTGVAGTADPLETHVFLESGEDDEFARTILDVSEQTCFLHAFCKTDLKTKIRIADFKTESAA